MRPLDASVLADYLEDWRLSRELNVKEYTTHTFNESLSYERAIFQRKMLSSEQYFETNPTIYIPYILLVATIIMAAK